jgi:hypothetical protein
MMVGWKPRNFEGIPEAQVIRTDLMTGFAGWLAPRPPKMTIRTEWRFRLFF